MMLWQLVGPTLPTPQFSTAPTPSALEVRIRAEVARRRVNRALSGRGAPPSMTPCWFCGNALAPDQVGLPCPVCRDGTGIAKEDPPPRVLGALARWRGEYGRQAEEWHRWVETAGR
jgi:hypothetical protein